MNCKQKVLSKYPTAIAKLTELSLSSPYSRNQRRGYVDITADGKHLGRGAGSLKAKTVTVEEMAWRNAFKNVEAGK